MVRRSTLKCCFAVQLSYGHTEYQFQNAVLLPPVSICKPAIASSPALLDGCTSGDLHHLLIQSGILFNSLPFISPSFRTGTRNINFKMPFYCHRPLFADQLSPAVQPRMMAMFAARQSRGPSNRRRLGGSHGLLQCRICHCGISSGWDLKRQAEREFYYFFKTSVYPFSRNRLILSANARR